MDGRTDRWCNVRGNACASERAKAHVTPRHSMTPPTLPRSLRDWPAGRAGIDGEVCERAGGLAAGRS